MTNHPARQIPHELRTRSAAVAVPRKQPIGHGQPAPIVLNTRPIEQPPKQVRQASPGDLSIGAAIGRAAIFVLLITFGGILLIAAAGVLFSSLLTGAAWLALLVGAGTLTILVTLGVNRTNHSGACPGIITHCRGCKH